MALLPKCMGRYFHCSEIQYTKSHRRDCFGRLFGTRSSGHQMEAAGSYRLTRREALSEQDGTSNTRSKWAILRSKHSATQSRPLSHSRAGWWGHLAKNPTADAGKPRSSSRIHPGYDREMRDQNKFDRFLFGAFCLLPVFAPLIVVALRTYPVAQVISGVVAGACFIRFVVLKVNRPIKRPTDPP